MIIRVIWILIVCIILFIVLLFLIVRIIKFSNYCRSNKNNLQLAEYVAGKYFVTRDMYRLESFGKINPQGKYIILAVHDLYGYGENFQNLMQVQENEKNSISLISYTQRNILPNEKQEIINIGVMFDDLTDACSSLKNQYPQQEIILLLEGFNAGFIKLISTRKLPVKKVIISNLISNFEGLKFKSTESLKKFISFFHTIKSKVNSTVNYELLVKDNKTYKNKLIAKKNEYYFTQLWQFQRLNNNVIDKVNNSKLQILIIQATDDIFYNSKQFEILTTNDQLPIYYFSSNSHFLFCEQKNIKSLWEVIKKFVF